MIAYDLKMNLRYRNSISNKETEIKILYIHKNVITVPVNFTGSYIEDELNFRSEII